MFKKIIKCLGPGLITGAADDDPSGIATYSQAGAQFGYSLLWSSLFLLPLQAGVQESCARIGAVTGEGLAAIVRKNYSTPILVIIIVCLLIANIINIGADIGAMAAATNLLIPINHYLLIVFFTILILALEIFLCYKTYAKFLKWLCLSLLAYPLSLIIIEAPWFEILKYTITPSWKFNFDYWFMLTALIGTTISPYLFFWQASEEVEERRERGVKKAIQISENKIKDMRIDNFIGMFFSQAAAWCIIVVTAVVLFSHGKTDIKSAADAAAAIEPLVKSFPNAGFVAKFIFAVGILGLGLLSIPILAGSGAYALAEAFEWKEGLNHKYHTAKGFYGVIIVSTALGMLMNFFNFNPIKALIYSAVLNGVASVPLLFIILKIASNQKIMGKYKSGILSRTLVGGALVSVTFTVLLMLGAYTV